jgi:hypothetical protein
MLRRFFAVAAVVGLVACGSDDSGDEPSGESVPITEECATEIECSMTKDSVFFGIPVPSDAEMPQGDGNAYVTALWSRDELTSFYMDYLAAGGWTFVEEESILDPAEAEASVGYPVTQTVYCREVEQRLKTLTIVIGDGAVVPGKADIFFFDTTDRETCP